MAGGELNGWTARGLDNAFREVRDDIAEVKRSVQGVERTLAGRAAERIAEADQRERDRVVTRRWRYGALFTAGGFILAAAAILLPLVGAGQ